MSTLYDEDVLLWSEQQTRLLRDALPRHGNEPIDWENVAEEIESLGKSQVTEVRNRLGRIIEHLLKLQFSPASSPRHGWGNTVRTQRRALGNVLLESPSLRGRLPELAAHAAVQAARDAASSLAEHGEDAAAAAVLGHGGHYSLDELLGSWLAEPEKANPAPARLGRRPRRG